ncbi:MAG: hypothetical protein IKH01_08235 [Prevotella sp.]|nr:hypothetical protein [Prevotella sp.]
MIAKLGNFSELSKLASVKSRIGDDIFTLFGMFRLSNFKLLMTNTFLTKRIFEASRYRPNQTLINHIFKELFGKTA